MASPAGGTHLTTARAYSVGTAGTLKNFERSVRWQGLGAECFPTLSEPPTCRDLRPEVPTSQLHALHLQNRRQSEEFRALSEPLTCRDLLPEVPTSQLHALHLLNRRQSEEFRALSAVAANYFPEGSKRLDASPGQRYSPHYRT